MKELLIKRGEALINAKKYAHASIHYEAAVKKFPDDPFLHYCYGVSLHQNKQIHEAIGAYSSALQINPKFTEAFENLSQAQTELHFFEDAMLSIQAAIDLNPQKILSHIHLARLSARLGLYLEAIHATTNALSFNPKNEIAYLIRSDAYRELNKLDESINDLRQAVLLDSTNAQYPYNLSFNLLLNEQFEEGWQCYESRFQTEKFIKNIPLMRSPKWDGTSSLIGKTILVYPEQGLGDQIQFSRYVLSLIDLGAKVILAVDPPLVEILQSLHHDVFVTSSTQPASALPKHDYHVALMSLMGIFKTDLSNIPNANRYLAPSGNIANKWLKLFGEKKKLQVGITWSGSQIHVNDQNRSMSLEQLQPLFDVDIDWHILQTEIRASDESLLTRTPIKDWRHKLANFHETAGLIEQLDLVITVDTSVAHLSAALGKPTWIMLPFAPDFRWLLNRTDSPWYPSVQLFRQPQPKDWDSVVTRIYDVLTGNRKLQA